MKKSAPLRISAYCLIVVCIFLFSRCTRLFHPLATKDFTRQLDTFSMDRFNGYYSDARVHWKELYRLRHWKEDNTFISDSDKLKLEFDGKNRLTVSIISDNDIGNAIVLKCRQKHDYLQIRRKFKVIPIPLIWYYEENKTVVGITPNDELYLKNRNHSFSWLFILVGETFEFEKSFFVEAN